MTAEEIVEKDREALYIGNTRTVEFDLPLPKKGVYGSDIRWISGHDRIITPEGKVTRPKFGMGTRTIKLTAVITCGDAEAERCFDVRVLEEENRIRIAKIYPIQEKAPKGQTYYLPSVAVVVTEDGKTISHAVEWNNHGEAVYEKTGFVEEHGFISGTTVPVTAGIEVVETLEAETVNPVPIVRDCSDGRVYLIEGSPFYQAQEWFLEFLLQVNDDQMLYNFRDAAGLNKKGAPEMIGWDAPDSNLRGHTTGHYLSGLALCYRATGSPVIRGKAEYMVHALRECQTALHEKKGCHKGFLSGYGEEQFDRLEQLVRYPEIWAPYYTLHKILAGLLDCYEFAGCDEALTIAGDLGDWVYERLSKVPHAQLNRMWSLYIAGEFGGMNDAMARLYIHTAKPEHLEAAKLFNNDRLFYPMAKNVDALDGLHANQHIPQMVGCMKIFEAGGETYYRDIARFFWEAVTGAHIYTIGGTGEGEMFHEAGTVAGLLTKNTAESCASYNMLKLTKELYQYQPSVCYMDYYERTVFNHIAASCEHGATGASTYFMPLAPGFHKDFEDENSCCHGTGLESHFKYIDSIYYHDADSIYVNLFIPSVLEAAGITIRQTTSSADPGHISVEVQGNKSTVLKIRVPYWCGGSYQLEIDGAAVKAAPDEAGYIRIGYNGSGSMRAEIRFACRVNLERTPDDPHTASLTYGPYVLAALTDSVNFLELPFDREGALEQLVKAEGEISLQYQEIKFVPLSSICHEPYQVYFKTI